MSEPRTASQPLDTFHETPATPREVLRRYHRAMAARSADALADLYAVDAVLEFPFFVPNAASKYAGREAIRQLYRAAWTNHPLEVDVVDDVFVIESADPEVVMGQWQLVGVLKAASRPVALTGLLVLRVRHGRVVHAREFIDGLGNAHALGRLPFAEAMSAKM
jgi:ketosteroid isomerase-like protein